MNTHIQTRLNALINLKHNILESLLSSHFNGFRELVITVKFLNKKNLQDLQPIFFNLIITKEEIQFLDWILQPEIKFLFQKQNVSDISRFLSWSKEFRDRSESYQKNWNDLLILSYPIGTAKFWDEQNRRLIEEKDAIISLIKSNKIFDGRETDMLLGERLYLERNHVQSQLMSHGNSISNESIYDGIVYNRKIIISRIRQKYNNQIKINQDLNEEVFITLYDWTSKKISSFHILVLLWLVSPSLEIYSLKE